MSIYLYVLAAVLGLAAGIAWFFYKNLRGRPAPLALSEGDTLPDFEAEDEDGATVGPSDLKGAPAVLLFVRGNWCPFCTRQVEDLSKHYRDITSLGAKLVFVTPKPLETTRRVADIFNVEFNFWLDPQLAVAKQLGLVHREGVPGKHREQFGEDTVWPTALVIDREGRVRHVDQSRRITDRPDPEELLAELKKL